MENITFFFLCVWSHVCISTFQECGCWAAKIEAKKPVGVGKLVYIPYPKLILWCLDKEDITIFPREILGIAEYPNILWEGIFALCWIIILQAFR